MSNKTIWSLEFIMSLQSASLLFLRFIDVFFRSVMIRVKFSGIVKIRSFYIAKCSRFILLYIIYVGLNGTFFVQATPWTRNGFAMNQLNRFDSCFERESCASICYSYICNLLFFAVNKFAILCVDFFTTPAPHSGL